MKGHDSTIFWVSWFMMHQQWQCTIKKLSFYCKPGSFEPVCSLRARWQSPPSPAFIFPISGRQSPICQFSASSFSSELNFLFLFHPCLGKLPFFSETAIESSILVTLTSINQKKKPNMKYCLSELWKLVNHRLQIPLSAKIWYCRYKKGPIPPPVCPSILDVP